MYNGEVLEAEQIEFRVVIQTITTRTCNRMENWWYKLGKVALVHFIACSDTFFDASVHGT